jgi:hypothetical protein
MSDAGDEQEIAPAAPQAEVKDAELARQYNLPIRAEKFRCSHTYSLPGISA